MDSVRSCQREETVVKEDEVEVDGSLFTEPEGYFPQEKEATTTTHRLQSGEVMSLRLVGHNPLWGHLLWNAGRIISDYLEEHAETLVQSKDVLELGAGAGLPSLVCASRSAHKVVITDYPDEDLVENIRFNVTNFSSQQQQPATIVVEGYLWGSSIERLSSHLETARLGFDLLILADVLFNHSEHAKLVWTVTKTLKKAPGARALVFFTPYRPWLLTKDLAFFDLAREAGLMVEKVLEKVMDKVMFDEDRGDELLRRTVYGYQLKWP